MKRHVAPVDDDEFTSAARELGVFSAAQLAKALGRDRAEVEPILRARADLVQPVTDRPGLWRSVPSATRSPRVPAAPPTPTVAAAATATSHETEVFAVTRELGVFSAADVARLAHAPVDVVEALLRTRPDRVSAVKGRAGMWRSNATPGSESPAPASSSVEAPAPARPVATNEIAEAVDESLKAVERGGVHEPDLRLRTLILADERLRIALASVGDAAEPTLLATLEQARKRLDRLQRSSATERDPLIDALKDWTVDHPLQAGDTERRSFDLDAALSRARRNRSDPNAVVMPAREALRAGLADAPDRHAVFSLIDQKIRLAALQSRVFAVVALGSIAAVCRYGRLSDAIVSALTTPQFYRSADRGARRMLYAALSNLAKPHSEDGQQAAEACNYIMQRERPGGDEIELLAPAALRAHGVDPRAILTLTAEWLRWESEASPSPESANPLTKFGVANLGHNARNLGCTLDYSQYAQLQEALPRIAENDLGAFLVYHLSVVSNDAIEIRTINPRGEVGEEPDDDIRQFGAIGRTRIIRITEPEAEHRRKRNHQPLPVRPGTTVARMIETLRERQPPELPARSFSDALRMRARRHV